MNCGTVGKIDRSALHFGFALQLGVVLDDAFHGAKHPRKGLLKIVGKDQNLVRCLLGESPAEGNCTVERGLAALLDATVQDRVIGQAASAIEGEGRRNISR